MMTFLISAAIFLAGIFPSTPRFVPGTMDEDGSWEMFAQVYNAIQPLNTPSIRNINPNNRTLCPETADNPRPPNRIDTRERVITMRETMERNNIAAYVMFNADQHLIGKPHFARVAYISGFSGESGYGAVTRNKAAVWVDGRYFLQSDNQMDCDWILMKIGEPGYPSIEDWLASEIGNGGVIAGDPRYISVANWETIDSRLELIGANMTAVTDLFDEFWNTDRPALLNNPLIIHELKFTGKAWTFKVDDVRARMVEEGADVLVLASLDDIAWLFNLRGTDQPRSPLFDSFALIKSTSIRLYLRGFQALINRADVQSHLNVNADGSCQTPGGHCIQVGEYEDMLDELAQEVDSPTVERIWVSDEYNYAIYGEVGEKRYVARSPIQIMKSVKNDVEKENYRKCQVRDSSYVVEFAARLEESIKKGDSWTELSASDVLTEIRSGDENYIMVSFDPISGAGENAAIIHYRPDNDTNSPITTDGVYLLDSGGNYLDGTTDVTRTFHFGTPTDRIKEAYTRVLIGQIELDSMVWPGGLYGSDFDAVARVALYEYGWDYQHGTGHGIGYGLNVHEGPGRIIMGFTNSWEPLEIGMFLSDEPGYYEAGSFGIRLENIFEIVEANTPNNFAGRTYFTFNAATLVPYEPHMIKYELLNAKQRRWLNAYNDRVMEEIGQLLLDKGKQQAYDWLAARTEHIPDVPIWQSDATTRKASVLLAALSVVFVHMLGKQVYV